MLERMGGRKQQEGNQVLSFSITTDLFALPALNFLFSKLLAFMFLLVFILASTKGDNTRAWELARSVSLFQ